MLSVCIALYINARAQSKTVTDSIKTALDKLLASKNAADSLLVNSRLATLAGSSQEREVILASRYYYRLGKDKTADSISGLQLKKFPLGIAARGLEEQAVFKEKTAAGKEKAYLAWVKKFPPEKFQAGEIDDNLLYDYARSAIAGAYAGEKNVAKALAYIDMLQVDFWKGNAYSGLSNAFYKNGDLEHAELFARKAMENAESYTNGKKGDSNAAKFAASGYSGLTSTYANILFERKKYAEALKFFEAAYKNAAALNPQLNFRYAQILAGLGREQDAYDKLDEVVKAGKASPGMIDTFKTLYIKVKGSEAGFSDYTAAVRKSYLDALQKKLAKDIIKEPAPGFVLKDLDGKQVSLADLKGKVVVLDFWATWCGPCKASFPAMQMAENKYKNDPGVKFLFIHTWERSAAAPKEAKAYVESNGYDFQVLMDLKDPETKANKVVSSYKVNGIPAKFIIDPQGNIRFKLTGFDGSKEAAVDELSMMIDMVKKDS